MFCEVLILKKKNQMTYKEAEKIKSQLEKQVKPSKKLISYVHDVLMKEQHLLIQYKVEKKRYGYCTHCGKSFGLDFGLERTHLHEYDLILESRQNENVICPVCGYQLTKKYSGISRKDRYAEVADFRVHKQTGALIIFLYYFTYRFDRPNIELTNLKPEFRCYNICYFEPHKHFYLLNGWGGSHVYLENKYASQLMFKKSHLPIDDAEDYRQENGQGIYCYNFENALTNSNMKYSCAEQFLGNDKTEALIPYLCFYSEYPELVENLMKQNLSNLVDAYLINNQSSFGVIDFHKSQPAQALRIGKDGLRLYRKVGYAHPSYVFTDIRTIQLMKFDNAAMTEDNFSKYDDFIYVEKEYKKFRNFVSPLKAMRYIERQEWLCRCQHCFSIHDFGNFQDTYKDYCQQCKQLGYDLNDKTYAMPDNLFQAHQQLTNILNQRKVEEENRKNKEKLKAFKKRLDKLKETYCFSDGNLLIRPAESYKDLHKEGTTLKHCVYTNYRERHISGETTILFIRKVIEPNKPFYTLEFKNNVVVQCRGKCNCGTTDEVQEFIEKWLAYIRQNKKKKAKKEVA